MGLKRPQVKKVIMLALYKVVRQASPPAWKDLKDDRISDSFRDASGPSGWPNFFSEAVATSIQVELMAHKVYYPAIATRLEDLKRNDGSWEDLEALIINESEPLT